MTITRTELLEIIYNGENSGVEFKRDVIQNDAFAKELVAFSNFEGGIVLLPTAPPSAHNSTAPPKPGSF